MNICTKTIFAFLLVSLFATACGSDQNAAQFTLSGKSSLESNCFESAFPLDAKISAARNSQNSISLLFKSAEADFDQANGIFIEVYQPDTVRKNLAQGTPISAPGSADAVVGAKLMLFAACPDTVNSFYLDGEIIFTALESGKNAHMAGTITDARVLNARTHEVVAEGLSGSWDFTVQPGQPSQTFYGLD